MASRNPYESGRPKHWKKGDTKLPAGTAGEYRIVDKETRENKYIGESRDLQRRLNQHTRKQRCANESTVNTDKSHLYDSTKHEIVYQRAKAGASTEARRKHEKQKIAKHDPSWNKNKGGGGRK